MAPEKSEILPRLAFRDQAPEMALRGGLWKGLLRRGRRP